MRTTLMFVAFLGTVVSAIAALQRPAEACGGCISPPDEVTSVDSHRMVVSLGLKETILWDQIIYSGQPSDFVWLLPVPTPEATIDLAESSFFDEMDAKTAPVIRPASPPPCGTSSTAAGCGGGGGGVAAGDGTPEDNVTVYDRGVVGPYEMVTIGSDDPQALFRWLAQNDYAVSGTTVPTLDHYIDSGSVFIALRLSPDKDVSAMQPVRVSMPGYMSTFPLEMVVVGASGVLELSLFVISEQRYASSNYAVVRVDENDVSWDWALSQSNYGEAFDAAIDTAGGRAWVVEYAAPLDATELATALRDGAPDDYELATGAIPYPYVTRLRTKMLVDHIDRDLELAPSEDPAPVSNLVLARIDLNYVCPIVCGFANGVGPGEGALLVVVVLGWLAIRRRKRPGEAAR